MDLSTGRKRISAEEKAKTIADGKYLDSGGFNHRAAECTAKKKTPMCNKAGVEIRR